MRNRLLGDGLAEKGFWIQHCPWVEGKEPEVVQQSVCGGLSTPGAG